MGWQGHLQLDYSSKAGRTIALDRHHGPQRVLQRLYPEGDAVCHHVLVHPPGGIVGGDLLELDATLAPGSHALITTPAATRFYRSAGPLAVQQVQAALADGARLEWLPQESIAYRRCLVENRLRFALAPGAQMIGWDLLALGLPAAGEPFDAGSFLQQLSLPGVWPPGRAGDGFVAIGVGELASAALGVASLPAQGLADLTGFRPGRAGRPRRSAAPRPAPRPPQRGRWTGWR
jgi:urease accessory protein